MVLIPAGSFTMGDSLDGMGDAIPVSTTVSAFYIDVNEVTYSQWRAGRGRLATQRLAA
jgi:formylglycine-generating enzyme required for sulfatase activity